MQIQSIKTYNHTPQKVFKGQLGEKFVKQVMNKS